MRRLRGKNKKNKGGKKNKGPQGSSEADPPPEAAASQGNGAPTADQKFLAELAVILAEEEEAKKQQTSNRLQQELGEQEERLSEITPEGQPPAEESQQTQHPPAAALPKDGLQGEQLGYAQPQERQLMGVANTPLLDKQQNHDPSGMAVSSDSLKSLEPLKSSSPSEIGTASMYRSHPVSPDRTIPLGPSDEMDEPEREHWWQPDQDRGEVGKDWWAMEGSNAPAVVSANTDPSPDNATPEEERAKMKRSSASDKEGDGDTSEPIIGSDGDNDNKLDDTTKTSIQQEDSDASIPKTEEPTLPEAGSNAEDIENNENNCHQEGSTAAIQGSASPSNTAAPLTPPIEQSSIHIDAARSTTDDQEASSTMQEGDYMPSAVPISPPREVNDVLPDAGDGIADGDASHQQESDSAVPLKPSPVEENPLRSGDRSETNHADVGETSCQEEPKTPMTGNDLAPTEGTAIRRFDSAEDASTARIDAEQDSELNTEDVESKPSDHCETSEKEDNIITSMQDGGSSSPSAPSGPPFEEKAKPAQFEERLDQPEAPTNPQQPSKEEAPISNQEGYRESESGGDGKVQNDVVPATDNQQQSAGGSSHAMPLVSSTESQTNPPLPMEVNDVGDSELGNGVGDYVGATGTVASTNHTATIDDNLRLDKQDTPPERRLSLDTESDTKGNVNNFPSEAHAPVKADVQDDPEGNSNDDIALATTETFETANSGLEENSEAGLGSTEATGQLDRGFVDAEMETCENGPDTLSMKEQIVHTYSTVVAPSSRSFESAMGEENAKTTMAGEIDEQKNDSEEAAQEQKPKETNDPSSEDLSKVASMPIADSVTSQEGSAPENAKPLHRETNLSANLSAVDDPVLTARAVAEEAHDPLLKNAHVVNDRNDIQSESMSDLLDDVTLVTQLGTVVTGDALLHGPREKDSTTAESIDAYPATCKAPDNHHEAEGTNTSDRHSEVRDVDSDFVSPQPVPASAGGKDSVKTRETDSLQLELAQVYEQLMVDTSAEETGNDSDKGSPVGEPDSRNGIALAALNGALADQSQGEAKTEQNHEEQITATDDNAAEGASSKDHGADGTDSAAHVFGREPSISSIDDSAPRDEAKAALRRENSDDSRQLDAQPNLSSGKPSSAGRRRVSISDVFNEFEDIKSSFARLMSVTSSTAATLSGATTPALSSTAATVSEVTAPALAEAGHVVSSSATAAGGIISSCRRELVRRRSERRSIVAFLQDDSLMSQSASNLGFKDEPIDEFQDSTLRPVALALSQDEIDTRKVPSKLALSSPTDLDQYRNDVSSFLKVTPHRGNPRDSSTSGDVKSLPSEQLRERFDAKQATRYEDPILKAATVGAENWKNHSSRQKARKASASDPLETSLRRFGDLTKETASTIATATLPALEEAKAIADDVRGTVGLRGQDEEEEEEVLLVCEDVAKDSLHGRAGSRKVFRAGAVEQQPMARNKSLFVVSSTSERQAHLESQGNRRPTTSARVDKGIVNASITNDLSRKASGLATTTAKGSDGNTPRSVLENPALVWQLATEKLHAVRIDGGQLDNVSGKESVVANELEDHSARSSISTPASPAALSGSSSSSSSSSEDDSVSTTGSTEKGFSELPKGVTYWDMVSTRKETNVVQSATAETPTSINVQSANRQPSNNKGQISFDVVSPLPMDAPGTQISGEEQFGIEAQITGYDDSAEGIGLPAMETHVEHPDENERIDLMGDSTHGERLEQEETGQDKTDVSDEGDPSMWESINKAQEQPTASIPLLPLKPFVSKDSSDLSLQASGVLPLPSQSDVAPSPSDEERPAAAKKRQRQSDENQFEAVRSAKSVDLDPEDGDSISQAGFMSLPGSQFSDNANEVIHNGSKRAREMNSPQNSFSWTLNPLASVANTSFSASKRGSLYSSRRRKNRRRASAMNRKGSKRLFHEDSVSQLSFMHDMSNSDIYGTSIRHSLSVNDLLSLTGETRQTGPSSASQSELHPDIDESSGVDGVLPDLALVACTTLAKSEIFKEIKTTVKSKPLQYLATVRWRQIVSKWKHHSLLKAIQERPTSSHFRRNNDDDSDDDEPSDFEESTLSTGFSKKTLGLIEALRKSHHYGRILPDTKNLNGLMLHLADGEMNTLGRFLGVLGSSAVFVVEPGQRDAKLAHIWQRKPGAAVTAQSLRHIARMNLKMFSGLVADTAKFAAKNQTLDDEDLEPEPSYSVGIKELDAIEKKAKRKYGGDMLQVKDILRAQITFEEEGSLVASLLHLFAACKHDRDSSSPSFDIVRVKNLFNTNASGELFPSNLPTGYRHILVNVRVDGQFLAEIQLQLFAVFDVLGYEGYTLHSEILDVDDACRASFESSSEEAKASAKQKGVSADSADKKEPRQEAPAASAKTSARPVADISKDENDNNDSSPGNKAADPAKGSNNPAIDSTKGEEGGESNRPASSAEVDVKAVDPADKSKDANSNNTEEKDGNPERETAALAPNNNRAKSDEAASNQDPANAAEGPSNTNDAGESERQSSAKAGDKDPTDEDSIVLLDSESTIQYLKDLRVTASKYTRTQCIDAVMAYAIEETEREPRDVPTLFCFHLLLMMETGRLARDNELWKQVFIDSVEWPLGGEAKSTAPTQKGETKVDRKEEDEQSSSVQRVRLKASLSVSKDCLLRCLAVSNQGTAHGMIGWLEYGASNSFGRIASSPFYALKELAYAFASAGDWYFAMDVLRAQVTRCDQHLPLYHPLTLTSLIHLAGAARKARQPTTSLQVFEEAAARLAFYLAEQEQSISSAFQSPDGTGTERENHVDVILCEPADSDAVSMLEAFVKSFEEQLSRSQLLQLVGVDGDKNEPNDISNSSHFFQGHAYSVLANCVAAREKELGLGTKNKSRTSSSFWKAAFKHYEACFKGLLSNKRKLIDESVVTAALGMTRCLRDLGQRGKALHILSSIVSAFGREDVSSSGSNYASAPTDDNDNQEQQAISTVSFAMPGSIDRVFRTKRSVNSLERRKELMALCLWAMARYSVEQHKSERGRMRALSLLHSAAETLRPFAVERTTDKKAASTAKSNSRTLLLLIEEEAKNMLEPIADAVEEAAPRQVPASTKSSPEDEGVLV
ncbi:expressed unknown protein [Seminavis robusta]|uniref:Uncharacterized protein n=1 Tax=Seminavis robusta TaxID=568900 RepID=A0A9N8DCL6_9STRA|nr:expressed unknown protein [Seminavis robusta]|eukprot:Sro61_g035140.1 n/a (3080) ;mRNA; f:103508-112826